MEHLKANLEQQTMGIEGGETDIGKRTWVNEHEANMEHLKMKWSNKQWEVNMEKRAQGNEHGVMNI